MPRVKSGSTNCVCGVFDLSLVRTTPHGDWPWTSNPGWQADSLLFSLFFILRPQTQSAKQLFTSIQKKMVLSLNCQSKERSIKMKRIVACARVFSFNSINQRIAQEACKKNHKVFQIFPEALQSTFKVKKNNQPSSHLPLDCCCLFYLNSPFQCSFFLKVLLWYYDASTSSSHHLEALFLISAGKERQQDKKSRSSGSFPFFQYVSSHDASWW